MFLPEEIKSNLDFTCNLILASLVKHPHVLSQFLANVPILYPLEILENLWFCGIFRGYKMETLARNGLTNTCY